MYATDITCPHCGVPAGHVCKDWRGIARWGKPHAARKKAVAALRESQGLPSRGDIPYNLFVRIHDHADGREVEHYVNLGEGVWGKQAAYPHRNPRMTLAMNDEMRDMLARNVPETHPVPFVTYRIYRMVGGLHHNRWAIACGNIPHDLTNFRVVDLATGNESALYSLAECRDLVALAHKCGLKGSFGLEAPL